jgi:CRP-like cAMP-binding protein
MSGQSEVFINLLRQVELFSGLSDAELRQIAETAVTLRRAKNQIIFDEGDSADFLLVLTKGRAKVVLVGDGAEEIILNLIEPFRVLGEIALLDRSTRSARLAALEDCQFIKVPVTAFDALRNSNPAFAAKIIANVTATLRESNDQLRVICTYRSLGKGCVVPGSPGATERTDQRVDRNARSVPEASRAGADDRLLEGNGEPRAEDAQAEELHYTRARRRGSGARGDRALHEAALACLRAESVSVAIYRLQGTSTMSPFMFSMICRNSVRARCDT